MTRYWSGGIRTRTKGYMIVFLMLCSKLHQKKFFTSLRTGSVLQPSQRNLFHVQVFERFLLHMRAGALCMKLAKLGGYTQFSTVGTRSLIRAAQGGPLMLPIAGALLAQAEASKTSSRSRTLQKWEQTLRMAWAGWPAGTL